MFVIAALSLSCSSALALDTLAAAVGDGHTLTIERALELRTRALAVADQACDAEVAGKAEELAFDLGAFVEAD